MRKLYHILFLIFFSYSGVASSDTIVIKVIEDRQVKRKSTRWTLTEWLRIKENEDDGCMVEIIFR